MARRRGRAGGRAPGLRPFVALLAGAILAAPAPGPARADDCAAPSAGEGRRTVAFSRGRVARVDERLELILADGRRLKIAGLDPPRATPNSPELDIEAANKLHAWLAGREATFRPLLAAPDRWGRLPAEIFAPVGDAPDAPAISVAGAALEAGLGRFDPTGAPRRCRAFLLAAEASARASTLGLWSDPYYAIMRAGDRAAFAERAGTIVIVEGRVERVERDEFRAALVLGERRGRDFSVSIPRRNLAAFAAAGAGPSTFEGKTVRVRGLLDLRFGPQIEIERPDEIEAQAEDGAAGAAPQR